MSTRIYLNNAGTSWPKPHTVYVAVDRAQRLAPNDGAVLLDDARLEVARFLGLPEPDRFLFTNGCTSALGLAILDLPWREGDVLVTSHLEHHALVRPVETLVRQRNVKHEVSPYAPGVPFDLDFVESVLRKGRVRLVACTMVCNVTGEVLPVEELSGLVHRHDALLLLDAAQAVGMLPVDVAVLGADLFVFAGHKAAMGPTGIGGLYVAPTAELACSSASCSLDPHDRDRAFPSYCDTGSANISAVAGLVEGLRWLNSPGTGEPGADARQLATSLRSRLAEIDGVRLHGSPAPGRSAATVAVTLRNLSPTAAESRLAEWGIACRAGLHCAPLAHRALGTSSTGVLRLSCGPFNTASEIDEVVAAMIRLAGE